MKNDEDSKGSRCCKKFSSRREHILASIRGRHAPSPPRMHGHAIIKGWILGGDAGICRSVLHLITARCWPRMDLGQTGLPVRASDGQLRGPRVERDSWAAVWLPKPYGRWRVEVCERCHTGVGCFWVLAQIFLCLAWRMDSMGMIACLQGAYRNWQGKLWEREGPLKLGSILSPSTVSPHKNSSSPSVRVTNRPLCTSVADASVLRDSFPTRDRSIHSLIVRDPNANDRDQRVRDLLTHR